THCPNADVASGTSTTGLRMRLKLFRAAGMADAMAQVRAELGAEALILNTRKVPGGIEITAALEPESDSGLTEPIRPPALPEPGRLAALIWHGVPRDLHAALAHGDLTTAVEAALAFGTI